MSHRLIDITGVGSVGPCGAVSGPLHGPFPVPSVVIVWSTAGVRYALPALPFRTADVLPKVNTRRLDRLSTWSLAAAALALRDAGLDLSAVDGRRTAVVSAIGLGCLDLTEAYLGSAHQHGWQQTDPIYFPETLGNVPAAHVARVFGCLGPNLTVGSRGLAAEAALLTAASLLRVGQADRVLVLAGDLLTRGLFDWYEVAGLLSADGGGFVPSEGVAAMVLEAPGRQRARARLLEARWVGRERADEGVGRGQAQRAPRPPHHSEGPTASSLVALVGLVGATLVYKGGSPCAIGDGLPDTGGLFRILTALATAAPGEQLLVLGVARSGSHAVAVLEVPADD
jgi:3-oxoacyl-[acyl-carrier-protein] synthase II